MAASEAGDLLSGRYRLRNVIGRGGMGLIWLAGDELLHRDVAVKEIHWPMQLEPMERETLRQRALREARTAAALDHPGIVRVFDVIENDGRPWIVMQLVPYPSLSDIVRSEGPLSPEQAAHVGLQILRAIQAAHDSGILHRDVKPGNVMIGPDDQVVLTDFGMAIADGSPTLTTSGIVIGSPAYLAPERARGERATPAADLWSLGATLYAAVEGRPPFDRDGPMEVLSAVVRGDPDPPSRAGPLWPAIEGLLRKRPEDRLDATQVEHLLRAVAGEAALPEIIPSQPAPEEEPADDDIPGGRVIFGPPDPAPGATAETEPAETDLAEAELAEDELFGAGPAETEPDEIELAGVEPAVAEVAGAELGGIERAESELAATELVSGELAEAELAGAGAADAGPADAGPAGTGQASAQPTQTDLASAGEAHADVADTELADAELVGAGAAETGLVETEASHAGPGAMEPQGAGPAESGPALTEPPGAGPTESGPTETEPEQPVGPAIARTAAAEPAELASFRDEPAVIPWLASAPDVRAQDAGDAGQPVPAETPGRRKRRRRRIAAAVGGAIAAAAIAAALAVAFLAGSAHPATGPAATPSASPSRATGTGGGGSTGASGSPASPSTVALPAGFYRYHDPTGFSIGVPAGWQISHDGHLVYIRDPGTARFLLIDQTDHPKPDPLADWRQQEAARMSTYPGYHRILLRAVRYPQAERAADWEFTYYRNGQLLRVLNRNVLANARHAYALYWCTLASDWTASFRYFADFAATFRPAGAG